QAEEHSITVVGRKGDRRVVHDPHEPWRPALERALRLALGIHRCQEEEFGTLDQRAISARNRVMHDDLSCTVCQPSRVKHGLKVPRTVAVEIGHPTLALPAMTRFIRESRYCSDVSRQAAIPFAIGARRVSSRSILGTMTRSSQSRA